MVKLYWSHKANRGDPKTTKETTTKRRPEKNRVITLQTSKTKGPTHQTIKSAAAPTKELKNITEPTSQNQTSKQPQSTQRSNNTPFHKIAQLAIVYFLVFCDSLFSLIYFSTIDVNYYELWANNRHVVSTFID